MHIPKTAGTTLASTLQWNYPPHLTLHGHVPYGVHRYIPRPCEYLRVLREPVSRVVSTYKHVLGRPRNKLHDQVVGEGMGLEDFIATYWLDKPVNRQTRQLSNRPAGESVQLEVEMIPDRG